MAPPRSFMPETALHMVRMGIPKRKVASMLNVTRSAVYKQLKLIKDGPVFVKQGRPIILSEKAKKTLVALARANKGVSMRALKKMMDKKGYHVCHKTIANSLHRLGFRPILSKKKKRLTRYETATRLKFARSYRNCHHRNWMFVDEKIFKNESSRRFCWIEKDDELPVTEEPKSRKKVQVWLGISWAGATKLFIFPEGQSNNSNEYTKLLKQSINSDPVWKKIRNPVLYQDNSRIHNTEQVRDMLEQKGIPAPRMPTYSPDINPIEHIWSIMEEYMPAIRSNTYEGLAREVQGAFKDISIEQIRACIEHLKVVKHKLIEKKGDYLVNE